MELCSLMLFPGGVQVTLVSCTALSSLGRSIWTQWLLFCDFGVLCPGLDWWGQRGFKEEGASGLVVCGAAAPGDNLGCSKLCIHGEQCFGGTWGFQDICGQVFYFPRGVWAPLSFPPLSFSLQSRIGALQLAGCFLAAVSGIVGLSAAWR